MLAYLEMIVTIYRGVAPCCPLQRTGLAHRRLPLIRPNHLPRSPSELGVAQASARSRSYSACVGFRRCDIHLDMRFYWGRGLRLAACALAVLVGCVLPEVVSAPEEGVTGTGDSAAVASEPAQMMSEPPPEAANASEPEPKAEAGAGVAGEAGAAKEQTAGTGGTAPSSAGCFRCEGVFLKRCGDSANVTAIAECTSPELCDAAGGKCQLAKCAPTSATCKGNTLSKCNKQGTGYEETVCGSKVCSVAHGSCDLCADHKECDGDVLVECDATGQGYKRTPCPSARPFCKGSRCVECLEESDCEPPSNSCTSTYCSLGPGTCIKNFRGINARCTLRGSSAQGYCNWDSICLEEPTPMY